MKRVLSLLLVLIMVLSFFAGCGGSQDEMKTEAPIAEATIQPTEAEPTTEPTTEPTLSPEEVLYNSLLDRMKLVVDVGIAELTQLEDVNRIITVGEASETLQKAYVHRTGVES